MARLSRCAAVGAGCMAAAYLGAQAFIAPSTGAVPRNAPSSQYALGAPLPAAEAGSWTCGSTVVGVMLGAHIGLAVAARASSMMRRAEAERKATAAEDRLFEQVFMDYTIEYVKGPMYWDELKTIGNGGLVDEPGLPMFKNGKITSNMTGNLKTFSSNELAALAMLFFGIGLYGNLQWNIYDPQWDIVDNGGNWNSAYIIESLCLPISFFFHIACYIQRKNGK